MSDKQLPAAAPTPGELMEQVIIRGDLERLTPEQRASHYMQVCESVGLNPLTQPFQYIKLSGRLTLYAGKGAADQLRRMYGISIGEPRIDYTGDIVTVTVTGTDAAGRTDTEIGAVPLPKGGEAACNAVMKALTKAKRRLTLSMCGLGMLDESEIETIPADRQQPARVDTATGEILEAEVEPPRRSNPDTVRRLIGRFDHCTDPAEWERIVADQEAAVQAGRLVEGGEGLPAVMAAGKHAQSRVKGLPRILAAYRDTTDATEHEAAERMQQAGVKLAWLLPGSEPYQDCEAERLLSLARIAEVRADVDALGAAVERAVESGHLAVDHPRYQEVLASVTTASELVDEREMAAAELEG